MDAFYGKFNEALAVFSAALTCMKWYGLLTISSGNLFVRPTTVTECGHRFCEDCIKNYLGHACKCPFCQLPARVKNLRRSPLHSNLVNWTKAMANSVNHATNLNLASFGSISLASSNISQLDFQLINSPSESICSGPTDINCYYNTHVEDKNISNADSSQNTDSSLEPEQKKSRSKHKRNISFSKTKTIESYVEDSVIFSKRPSSKLRYGAACMKNASSIVNILLSNGTISVGSIASCFDFTAKITSIGTFVDEIDLQEYKDPFAWAVSVSCSAKSCRLSRQSVLKVVKIGGKSLEELINANIGKENSQLLRNLPQKMTRRSSQDTGEKFVFSISRLSHDQIKFLENHQSDKYSIIVSPSVDISSSTHLIVDTDVHMRCRRTLKCLFALLTKKPIVSFQWVLDSIENGEWTDIEGYLVTQDHQGRVFKIKDDNGGHGLFSFCTFFCVEIDKAESPLLSPSVIKTLISAGNGTLFPQKSYNMVSLGRISRSLFSENITVESLIVIIDVGPKFSLSKVKVPLICPEDPFKGYAIRSTSWLLDAISFNTTSLIDPFDITKNIS